jgi:hypothetical protein
MENPSRSKYMITGVSFTLLAMVLVAGGTDDPIIMTGAILLSILMILLL